MLGKTANGLFWLSRYLERAENTARLIETGQRLALTRLSDDDSEWKSVLQSAGVLSAFHAENEKLTRDAAVDWMLRERNNPSSVRASIEVARQNARIVRTAITGEVWEAINAAYMASQEFLARKVPERDLPKILRKTRQNIALVRGMIHGTMMRNEPYNFLRIGTYLERADNTARILDVKYYMLLPSVSSVGSSIDNIQWESILRSVSARGGFRMEYGGGGGPREIVHFLILDKRMPRSLAYCVSELRNCARHLGHETGKPLQTSQIISRIQTQYLSHDVQEIFDFGLHEYIQVLLGQLSELAGQIEADFRFYE